MGLPAPAIAARPFRCLTTRGRSFATAGAATVIGGLAVGEPELVRVGALLAALPLMAALTVLRPRVRLSCARRRELRRVAAGEPADVVLQLANESPRPVGLLAEDVLPAVFGNSPRFAIEGIEPGERVELRHRIQPPTRGRFTIGPLRSRAVDVFGMVEIARPVGAASTLLVTPRIVPLAAATPSAVTAASPLSAPSLASAVGAPPGAGGAGRPARSPGGDDGVVPRPYRAGDGLHRVHWKSTARRGELMVRLEEERRATVTTLFLDTRGCAHAGRGAASTFEFAVSAAASIGAHLSGAGGRIRLVTDAGELAAGGVGTEAHAGPGAGTDAHAGIGAGAGAGTSTGAVLDRLAVIGASRGAGVRAGLAALAGADGPVIAVVGRLSAQEARALAAAGPAHSPAMALLLAVSGWNADDVGDDTARAAKFLAAAGWRVAVATAGAALATAWQELHGRVGVT